MLYFFVVTLLLLWEYELLSFFFFFVSNYNMMVQCNLFVLTFSRCQFHSPVWNNVYSFDMSCIKKQALMEPLVHTFDQNHIVTNCELLKVRITGAC